MLRIGTQFFAEPADEEPVNSVDTTPDTEINVEEPEEDVSHTELKRLQNELAKQKAALDKATKEASAYKKQLRASQSAEEQRAEEEREEHERMKAELEELRKQSAVGNISKKVLSFIGDEKKADSIAEGLYGASDVDLVLDSIQKAWNEHEKKLKLEYERPTFPTGGDIEGEKPRKDVEMGKKFGQAKVNAMKYSNDGLKRFMK